MHAPPALTLVAPPGTKRPPEEDRHGPRGSVSPSGVHSAPISSNRTQGETIPVVLMGQTCFLPPQHPNPKRGMAPGLAGVLASPLQKGAQDPRGDRGDSRNLSQNLQGKLFPKQPISIQCVCLGSLLAILPKMQRDDLITNQGRDKQDKHSHERRERPSDVI